MDATTRFNTQRVGALPVIAAYLEKLRLREIIDEFVPWEGEVSLGTLVEVMICNRMLNPKAQYKIGEWAQRSGICEYYGVSPEQLNDDLLGRALERVAAHAFTVQVQLVLHVIKTFGLDVGKIHYDISNVELYGAYERQLNEAGLANAGAQSFIWSNQERPKKCETSAVRHQCGAGWSRSYRLDSVRW